MESVRFAKNVCVEKSAEPFQFVADSLPTHDVLKKPCFWHFYIISSLIKNLITMCGITLFQTVFFGNYLVPYFDLVPSPQWRTIKKKIDEPRFATEGSTERPRGKAWRCFWYIVIYLLKLTNVKFQKVKFDSIGRYLYKNILFKF